MEHLKPLLRNYLALNKDIGKLNKELSELRDTRHMVEMDMAAVYNEKGAELQDKIDLTNSQMTFVVKKPAEWKKGWTMSKKQLEGYLKEILPEHGEDVMRQIVLRHERTLVADDYGFELKPMKKANEVI